MATQAKKKKYEKYKYNIFRSIMAIFVATVAAVTVVVFSGDIINNESAHRWTEYYICVNKSTNGGFDIAIRVREFV